MYVHTHSRQATGMTTAERGSPVGERARLWPSKNVRSHKGNFRVYISQNTFKAVVGRTNVAKRYSMGLLRGCHGNRIRTLSVLYHNISGHFNDNRAIVKDVDRWFLLISVFSGIANVWRARNLVVGQEFYFSPSFTTPLWS